MKCPQCGRIIHGKALFCPQCGQRLPQEWPKPVATPPPAPLTNSAPSYRPAQRQGCGLSLTVIVVTLIVLLAILGLGVLGAYVGMRDRARVEQQAAQEHYQKGQMHLQANELALAAAEFEVTLRLAPQHAEAKAALAETRRRLQAAPTATPAFQVEKVQVDQRRATYDKLAAAYAASDWAEVIVQAETLMAADPTFERVEVDRMLFDAYYNSGQQLVEQDRITEAARLFERALLLKPNDAQAAEAIEMATLYSDALSYWNADWGQTIAILAQLYDMAPNYRDVRARMLEATRSYGDQLAESGAWCEAEKQYAASLAIAGDAKTEAKFQEAKTNCIQVGPMPTPGPGGTPSPFPKAPSGAFTGRITKLIETDGNRMFIRGQVFDKKAKPVVSTRVQIKAWDWSASAVTDGSGQYSFDGLNNPVTYTLTLLDHECLPVDAPGIWGKITWVDFQEAK